MVHRRGGLAALIALTTLGVVLFGVLAAPFFVPGVSGFHPPPSTYCSPQPCQVSGPIPTPQQVSYTAELPALRLALEAAIGVVVLLAAVVAVRRPAGPHSRRIGK